MNKAFITRMVILACLLCLYSTTALAIEKIPNESGFSGYIQLGAGVYNIKSNMIAGIRLGSVGKEKTDSLTDSPDSKTSVLPAVSAEVRYTFDGTRTQLYAGNSLEDLIRFDLATLLGVRQELPDSSIVALSYVFSGIPTEVWEDPYLVGTDREETDRTARGVRVTFDRILGSGLQIEYTYRKFKIDDELSGTSLGLTDPEKDLLRREGDQHNAEVLYVFWISQNQRLGPSFKYTKFDLDGEAMSRDRYTILLTHLYTKNRFSLVTNLSYATADYDKENPIYAKTQEKDSYGVVLTGFYRNPFMAENWVAVLTIAYANLDSNIDFYDTQVSTASLSAMYRF